MMMIGDIYVKTSSVIDMINSFYQSVLFKCRYCSINSIKRYCLQVFSNPTKHVFGCRMVSMFQQGLKNLGSLMSYAEPSGFADFFKPIHHLGIINAAILHYSYNKFLL